MSVVEKIARTITVKCIYYDIEQKLLFFILPVIECIHVLFQYFNIAENSYVKGGGGYVRGKTNYVANFYFIMFYFVES